MSGFSTLEHRISFSVLSNNPTKVFLVVSDFTSWQVWAWCTLWQVCWRGSSLRCHFLAVAEPPGSRSRWIWQSWLLLCSCWNCRPAAAALRSDTALKGENRTNHTWNHRGWKRLLRSSAVSPLPPCPLTTSPSAAVINKQCWMSDHTDWPDGAQ